MTLDGLIVMIVLDVIDVSVRDPRRLIVVLLAWSDSQTKHDRQQPVDGRETNRRLTNGRYRSLVRSSCEGLQSTSEWRMKKYYNLFDISISTTIIEHNPMLTDDSTEYGSV